MILEPTGALETDYRPPSLSSVFPVLIKSNAERARGDSRHAGIGYDGGELLDAASIIQIIFRVCAGVRVIRFKSDF